MTRILQAREHMSPLLPLIAEACFRAPRSCLPIICCFSRRWEYLRRMGRGTRDALRRSPAIVASTRICWVVVVASGASVGCGGHLPDTLYWKARNQFGSETTCPSDQIKQWPRNDLGQAVYDLQGCGQRARYNCLVNLYGRPTCLSEPLVGAFAVPKS